jgi:hypothetical protein
MIRKLQNQYFEPRDFNISFKSTSTVASLIKPIKSKEVRDMDNFEKDGVVYKLTCETCYEKGTVATYIGETGRLFKTRYNEHLRIIKNEEELQKRINEVSPVQKHSFQEHKNGNSWKAEVLDQSFYAQDRKVLEAYYIRDQQPTLNMDRGITVII